MDSRQVHARFDAERQALAMMDHVNIARVFDGGTTDRRPHAPREEPPHAEREVYVGRPYFVMELVQGVPITKSGNNDSVAKTGTLTFAPGETTKTITIDVKDDTKKEANKTFCLDLFGNSTNSVFPKNRGLGTILNDD